MCQVYFKSLARTTSINVPKAYRRQTDTVISPFVLMGKERDVPLAVQIVGGDSRLTAGSRACALSHKTEGIPSPGAHLSAQKRPRKAAHWQLLPPLPGLP